MVKHIACSTNDFTGKFLTFKLEFDYAARKHQNLATSTANVVWNNVVIGTISPNNYGVKHAVFYVQLRAGHNYLSFDASGSSNSFGLSIDNVKLSSKYNHYYNLIKNGGFEHPDLGGQNFKYFPGGIPAWKALNLEIGKCSVYNPYWPANSGQCLEVDSDANQRVTQVITVSYLKFNEYIINKATITGDASVHKEISCAINNAQNKISSAIAKLAYDVYCQIDMTADAFDKYLCKLYKVSNAHVKDLKQDSVLTIKKYDCLSKAYVGKYGKSYEHDYFDDAFDPTNLDAWEGYIEHIHGKVIRCRDKYGHKHYLQIAPCSHFEGQFALPAVGAKIYWKGKKQPCGKTFVKWATTCNC